MGGYSAGRRGWVDSSPARDGPENISRRSGASDTLGSRCHGWHFVASVICRAPLAGASIVPPPLPLHPLRDRRGVKSRTQPMAPTRPLLGEAPGRRLRMDP